VTDFYCELNQRLAAIREQGLYRELRCIDSAQSPQIAVAGKTLLNFSSNDYLGLANHPALKESAIKAVERFGAGSGASRLINSLAPHHELEEALAIFKGTEAALSFSSGYATAIGAICALLGKDDVIILDKLVHACIVDAARLCGAKLRVFAHNDLNDLEGILQRTDKNRQSATGNRQSRTLIVTESVFSMNGDHTPLREIAGLKEKHGAWLMMDEAHATGLYGERGQGLASQLGLAGDIEIHMGTLGKALGAAGGFVAGSRALIDFLINRARSFIFSTAPVPAAAAAAAAAVQLVQSAEGKLLRNKLWARVGELSSAIGHRPSAMPNAIFPLMVGNEAKAVELAGQLRARGFFVPAIRYPAVARGQARLRLTLTAAHTTEDVSALIAALEAIRHTQHSFALRSPIADGK